MPRALATKRRNLGGTYTPDQIPGLTLWLKADAITGLNDGDAVSSWLDSGTGANNATNAGAAGTKPTYKTNIINGLPVLRFDGGDGLTVANAGNFDLPVYTIFLVAQKTSGTGSYMGKSTTALGQNPARRKFNLAGSTTSLVYESGSDANVISQAISAGVYSIYSVTAKAQSNHDITINGVLNNQTTILFDPVFNTAALLIGSNFGIATEGLVGDIAEVIFFNSALMLNDLLGVTQYLSSKYNISTSVTLAPARLPLITTTNTDSFTRADSPTNLGSTNEGVAWQQLSGTWGIQSNRAYDSGVAPARAVIDTGIGNYTSLSATINMPLGNRGGLLFRCTDVNNWLSFEADQGQANFVIRKLVAGVVTTLVTGGTSVGINDQTIQVILRDKVIQCFYGGVQIFNYTLSDADYNLFPRTKTKAGLAIVTTNTIKFDNFVASMTITPRTLAVGRTLAT